MNKNEQSTNLGLFSKVKAMRERWRSLLQKVDRLEGEIKELNGIITVVLGDLEYKADPLLGMNGQVKRKAMIETVFEKLDLGLIIETGTYLGATSGYFATTFNVPVHTCELVPKNHYFSKKLLRSLDQVHLTIADSRTFLKGLAEKPEIRHARPLFYLDAHWYNDLPLREEIEIIAENWSSYAILVDDFKVPGDEGYAYDDYGLGKSLDLGHIEDLIKKFDQRAYFPTADSREETGKRSGCVLLVPANLSQVVEGIPSLELGSK